MPADGHNNLPFTVITHVRVKSRHLARFPNCLVHPQPDLHALDRLAPNLFPLNPHIEILCCVCCEVCAAFYDLLERFLPRVQRAIIRSSSKDLPLNRTQTHNHLPTFYLKFRILPTHNLYRLAGDFAINYLDDIHLPFTFCKAALMPAGIGFFQKPGTYNS